MLKLLQIVFPELTWAKLIAWAAAILVVIAALLTAFLVAKGWRDDAAALPGVKAQLAQSQARYAALDGDMTKRLDGLAGTLNGIGDRLKQNDQARQAADARVAAAQAATSGDVQTFLRSYRNALPATACPLPQPVRDGLLGLFPARPQSQPGDSGGRSQRDGGNGAGAGATGSPHAAFRPDRLPGRQRDAGDRRALGMPAAARADAGAANGHGAGDILGGDQGAAGRHEPARRALAVGAAPAGFLGAFRARIAATWSLIGTMLLAAAWDDRWDA